MKYLLLVAMLFATNVQAKAITFNCDFPLSSNDKHGPKSQNYTFDIRLDTQTGDAVILGENGHAQLNIITFDKDQFAVLEITPSGSAMTTTIALAQASYEAVHSRHTVVMGMGEIIPSQHYGKCLPQ